MTQTSVQPLSVLHGREIVRWVATEMALAGGSQCEVWNESQSQWTLEYAPIEWSHPSVPYLQFTGVDIQLACGKTLRLLSQLDDGSGFHGLYLIETGELSKLDAGEAGSVFRTREISELPLGLSKVEVLRRDGPKADVEARISIGSSFIRLLAAEVHDRGNGSFGIVEGDESILMQLNGTTHDLKENLRMDATTLISFLGHSSVHPPFDEFLFSHGIKKRPKKIESTDWVEDKKFGISLEFSATESFDSITISTKKSSGRFILKSVTFSDHFSGPLPYGISLTQSREEIDQHLESLPLKENIGPTMKIATYFKNGTVIVIRRDKRPADSFIRFYLPTIHDEKNLGLHI